MLRYRFLVPAVAAFLILMQFAPLWAEATSKLAQSSEANMGTSDPDLLTPRGVVRCPASDESRDASDPAITSALPRSGRFVAQEHFRESSSPQAPVSISWLGATFRERFVNKVEEHDGGVLLRTFELRQSASAADVATALNIHHETKLADLWCLLSRQADGEPGILLTNAVPNMLYVRDANGVLAVVDAVWSGAGWEIGASSIASPHHWQRGSRALAR